jgi:hypothetical protein
MFINLIKINSTINLSRLFNISVVAQFEMLAGKTVRR